MALIVQDHCHLTGKCKRAVSSSLNQKLGKRDLFLVRKASKQARYLKLKQTINDFSSYDTYLLMAVLRHSNGAKKIIPTQGKKVLAFSKKTNVSPT